MVRFWSLWPLAGLLALMLGTIHLVAVRFPYSFVIDVGVESLIGGLMAAVVAEVSTAGSSTLRSLLIRVGCVILSVLAMGFLTWLPFLLFWHSALSFVGITIGLVIGAVLIVAPAFAGLNAELPHLAIVRSVRSAGYGLILMVLLFAVLGATHENIFPIHGSLGPMIRAAAMGAIWTGAVLIIRSRSFVPSPDTHHEAGRSPLVVVLAAQSIWLGYLISVANLVVAKPLPSGFWSWDPLFKNWSLCARVFFAGTTASLVLAICMVALLIFIWRVPLWMHLTAVISFRIAWLLGFPGWNNIAQHPLMVLAGLAFFATVAVVLHWMTNRLFTMLMRERRRAESDSTLA